MARRREEIDDEEIDDEEEDDEEEDDDEDDDDDARTKLDEIHAWLKEARQSAGSRDRQGDRGRRKKKVARVKVKADDSKKLPKKQESEPRRTKRLTLFRRSG